MRFVQPTILLQDGEVLRFGLESQPVGRILCGQQVEKSDIRAEIDDSGTGPNTGRLVTALNEYLERDTAVVGASTIMETQAVSEPTNVGPARENQDSTRRSTGFSDTKHRSPPAPGRRRP